MHLQREQNLLLFYSPNAVKFYKVKFKMLPIGSHILRHGFFLNYIINSYLNSSDNVGQIIHKNTVQSMSSSGSKTPNTEQSIWTSPAPCVLSFYLRGKWLIVSCTMNSFPGQTFKLIINRTGVLFHRQAPRLKRQTSFLQGNGKSMLLEVAKK